MTTEHKYAQVLRWIADGKKVQFKSTTGAWVEEHVDHTLTRIGKGLDGYQFRLAPRAVMIGDVECEAPVIEPSEGQELWFWVSDDNTFSSINAILKGTCTMEQARRGEFFATRQAAEAAHAAWVKLMTGASE